MTPLVAITGLRAASVEGLRFGGYAASQAVVDAVRRAGGTPVVLPPVPESAQIDLEPFACLVVPGGHDVDPALYTGGEKSCSAAGSAVTSKLDRAHDEVEIALLRRAVEDKVPTLAICRGMQVLNVALGGSLVPDLDPTDVPHSSGFHDVVLEGSCLVARAMGRTKVSVSSYHHQSVDRLGEGLRVTGWAPDLCVEVIEHVDAPVLAIQWHPEDNAHQAAEQQALFDTVLRMQSFANLASC